MAHGLKIKIDECELVALIAGTPTFLIGYHGALVKTAKITDGYQSLRSTK